MMLTPRPKPVAVSPTPRRGALPILVLLLALTAGGCDGERLQDPLSPDPGNGGTPADPVPGPGDAAVRIQVEAPDRLELTDSIRVRVEGWDPDARVGIAQLGFSAVIRHPETHVQFARTGEGEFRLSPGDTVSATFHFAPNWMIPESVPSEFEIQIYGWAENHNGICVAGVPEDADRLFECRTALVDQEAIRVGAARSEAMGVTIVAGRTTPLPTTSVEVGDLQVDTLRGRAFISNRLSNRLHVLRPGAFEWEEDVRVGAGPWGLHIDGTGDTLLVANSGGTSISYVTLEGGPREVVSRRLQTRNTALFELPGEVPVNRIDHLNFSDRPQFVAQDGTGRILYSTRPTPTAPLGTVRVIEQEAGWEEPNTRILARLPDDLATSQGRFAVAHVDSIVGFEDGEIEVFDHRPGFPSQVIRSGKRPVREALEYMRDQTDSDIEFRENRSWHLDAVAFADTTYVAASRNRNWIAFGGGGPLGPGRVLLWQTGTGEISSRLSVSDLLASAGDQVRALQLNRDGTLGIARGGQGTYFFSNDLRLQGSVPEAIDGGGGIALHPDHPDTPAPTSSSHATVAFTASGDRAIRILDTVHYTERGRIPVRDRIRGPIRVTPPLPSDNDGQGRSCSGSECVLAKVFAVTEGGGILVLDVRASDLGGLP